MQFAAIPVRIGGGASSSHSPIKIIYARPHADKGSEAHKTLFACNMQKIPESVVGEIFARFGTIESIELQRKEGYARIAFKQEEAVASIMKMKFSDWGSSLVDIPLLSSASSLTGLDKWEKEQESKMASVRELQQQVDAYMDEFDRAMAEAKAKEDAERNKPDEEGWVTVSRGGRRNRAAEAENVFGVGVATKKSAESSRQAKKQTLLRDFYTFQKREAKRLQLVQLRKQFEADKIRISKMKEGRKFEMS